MNGATYIFCACCFMGALGYAFGYFRGWNQAEQNAERETS